MSASIAWLHVGDLHAGAADSWLGVERLAAIVAWPQAGILGTRLGPNRNGGAS